MQAKHAPGLKRPERSSHRSLSNGHSIGHADFEVLAALAVELGRSEGIGHIGHPRVNTSPSSRGLCKRTMDQATNRDDQNRRWERADALEYQRGGR